MCGFRGGGSDHELMLRALARSPHCFDDVYSFWSISVVEFLHLYHQVPARVCLSGG